MNRPRPGSAPQLIWRRSGSEEEVTRSRLAAAFLYSSRLERGSGEQVSSGQCAAADLEAVGQRRRSELRSNDWILRTTRSVRTK